jgi:hypothetical protein
LATSARPGCDFVIRYVTSIKDVETVLHDPDISKKLGYKVVIDKILDMTHIGCYDDHKIAALLCVEDSKKSHFYCLKPYRKHAAEIARDLINMAPQGIYFRVTSKAIENFGKKVGFV